MLYPGALGVAVARFQDLASWGLAGIEVCVVVWWAIHVWRQSPKECP